MEKEEVGKVTVGSKKSDAGTASGINDEVAEEACDPAGAASIWTIRLSMNMCAWEGSTDPRPEPLLSMLASG